MLNITILHVLTKYQHRPQCFCQMTRLFGVEDDFGEDAILGRLEGMKDVIEQVNMQFKDPVSSFFPILWHLNLPLT